MMFPVGSREIEFLARGSPYHQAVLGSLADLDRRPHRHRTPVNATGTRQLANRTLLGAASSFGVCCDCCTGTKIIQADLFFTELSLQGTF